MRDRLRAVFADVIIVDVLDSQDAAHLALLQRPELGITFTKIHCWNLTQYDKCVFLDADTLVVQNSDELFEREQLSAAPDVGWPDCFNSGVFVFSPSADTFSRLITFAQERGSFDGGDQGLLNSFFSDWAHGDINKHLPFLYNVTSAAFYSYLPALKHFGQNLKIIHFIGAAKPWLQQYNFESGSVDAPEHIRGFLQLWWDIFVGHVHIQLDTGMVEVEDTRDVPPALPPLDVRHQYYQPTLDPESEFAWHHPDAQAKEEPREKQIDVSKFHDPWEIYRGHIPPHTDDAASHHVELGRIEDHEEIRKYAWDYQAQAPPSTYSEHSSHLESQTLQTDHWHHDSQYEHRHEQHGDNWHRDSQYEHSYDHHHQQHGDHWHHDSQHEHRHEQHQQQHDDHWHHDSQLENRHDQHQYEHHDQDHHHVDHWHQKHHHDWNTHEHHQHTNTHNHHHDHSSHPQHVESNYHVDSQKYEHTKHSYNNSGSFTQLPQTLAIHEEVSVRHVHVARDKKRGRRHRRLHRIDTCGEHGLMNGDVSESESEDDIIPRHPYDDFYLRHRVTIDARGRKVCSHEIPPTPSPSPPPESPSPINDDISFPEDRPSETNDFEVQTGVAGNLARVMPGAAGQREALDELSRRQGWEAGNIDYMGADSFENIWAKISQTLSKPRTSPVKTSPPREPTPQPAPEPVVVQSGEVVQEPVVEQVELAKEAVPTESAAPLAARPAPTEVAKVPVSAEIASPIEAPAPVQEPPVVPVSVEAVIEHESPKDPARVEVPASAQVPKTVEIPAASEVPVSVEAVVPDVPAPVEALAPVETAPAAPAKVEAPKAPKAVVEQAEKKTETPVVAPKVAVGKPAPASPAAAPAAVAAVTPEKAATDSPPLANTPSKEEAPAVPAAKSEERRKPAGKLKLCPPAAADPLPTPDSELEDAAALASDIIARELRTPTVTAPEPAPAPSPSPTAAASPAAAQLQRLAVEEPEVPTPPVGAVSLAQIGVKTPKGKSTTAAQIESSITETVQPATPATSLTPATPTSPTQPGPPADAPKKKIVKKVVKKEGAAGSEAPVPPPRKKEKKPKEK